MNDHTSLIDPLEEILENRSFRGIQVSDHIGSDKEIFYPRFPYKKKARGGQRTHIFNLFKPPCLPKIPLQGLGDRVQGLGLGV